MFLEQLNGKIMKPLTGTGSLRNKNNINNSKNRKGFTALILTTSLSFDPAWTMFTCRWMLPLYSPSLATRWTRMTTRYSTTCRQQKRNDWRGKLTDLFFLAGKPVRFYYDEQLFILSEEISLLFSSPVGRYWWISCWPTTVSRTHRWKQRISRRGNLGSTPAACPHPSVPSRTNQPALLPAQRGDHLRRTSPDNHR